MTEKIKSLIANLKHLPGVYLMHDKDDNIIYVGKAKDLQKRVSQYFLRPQAGKVFKMVCNVSYFETIITKNEKEAFILEMNLIQKYLPRYNILLKDDSHYPYIALKKGNDPVLRIKRNKKEKGYEYFGPFPSASAAYETVDLLNKLFPIRKCQNIPSSACLYFHLGECLAPCINKVKSEDLETLRNNIATFLNGNNAQIRNDIVNKMNKASELLEFERAKEYNDIIKAIDHINIKQTVESNGIISSDIFAFATRNDYLAISVLTYRKGILLGKHTFIQECFDDLKEEIKDLIVQYYEKHELPNEIIINDKDIANELDEILDSNVTSVSKGRYLELIVTAKENASNGLDEYFLSARLNDDRKELLEALGKTLNIKTPYHIELFDNSHLQGSLPVGAMVAFINGEPVKRLYRKFNIQGDNTKDDYASMKEVISRHYLRLKNENKKFPDLILVDGGLGQVHAAVEALDSVKVNINVFGLYKGQGSGHQTTGIIDKDGKEYPIEDKKLFFLLTRMQDEVHRFAINFHISKRDKKMKESFLDDIKGLGLKRKELILRAYTDIDSLKKATLEELQQILPNDVAKNLYGILHK